MRLPAMSYVKNCHPSFLEAAKHGCPFSPSLLLAVRGEAFARPFRAPSAKCLPPAF